MNDKCMIIMMAQVTRTVMKMITTPPLAIMTMLLVVMSRVAIGSYMRHR